MSNEGFVKTLSLPPFADDENNRIDIEDDSVSPVVQRSKGYVSTYGSSGSSGTNPDRRRINALLRQWNGAALTKRSGIPQYQPDIDYATSMVAAVEDRIYEAIGINGPSTAVVHPESVGQTKWRSVVGAIQRPSPPRDFKFGNDLTGILDIQWKPGRDNGSEVNGYDFQSRRVDDSAWSPPTPRGLVYPHEILDGLRSGERWLVRARSKTDYGVSDWAQSSTTIVNGIVVNEVTGSRPEGRNSINLDATAGDASVDLDWIAPYDGGFPLTRYTIEWKRRTSNIWADSTNVAASYRSHTITGLTNGVLYDFQVQAHNRLGAGEWSNTASATPEAETQTVPPILLAPKMAVFDTSGFTATATLQTPDDVIYEAFQNGNISWQYKDAASGGWGSPRTGTGRVLRSSGHLSSGTRVKARFKILTDAGNTTAWSPTGYLTLGGARPDAPVSIIGWMHYNGDGTHSATFNIVPGSDNGSPITTYGMNGSFDGGGVSASNSDRTIRMFNTTRFANHRGKTLYITGSCRNRFGWSFRTQGNPVPIP